MAKARRAKRKSLAVSVEMDMEELSSSSSGQINASAMRTSADGRRVYRHNVAVPTPSPSKRQCTHSVTGDIDAADPPSDELGPLGDERLWIPVEATSAISSKYPAKRYTSSDEPLKEWQRSACQEYLMEFVRLEGPGAITTSKCGACDLDIKDGLPYRCKDCFSGLLLCEGCLLRAHYEHPLHVIERRMVSSVEKDPGLGIDWGYFVEAEPFRQYLLSVTDQKECASACAQGMNSSNQTEPPIYKSEKGVLLLKRLKSAIAERGVQQASFEIFAGQQGSRVEMWKKMVKEFEADGSKPNPYEVPKTGLTENDVRLQFAREESTAETDGGVMPHKVTRSGFISEGLDIEEQQQRARSTIHEKKTGTTVQQADIIDIRTRLTRSITHFRMLQAVYLPMALTELSARVVPEGEEAEAVPVILPSSLSSEGRAQCDQRLLEVERRLREARCQSALDDLRNLLFVKSRLVSYKDRNVRHQAANTRARTLINRNESKIKLQALKYETSRSALKTLAGGDEKGLKWPALKPEHIRCMEDPDTTKKKEVCNVRASESGRDDVVVIINEGKQGSEEEEGEDRAVVACEGYRTISWIWMDAVGRGSANGEEMDAVLRCEFAKSWARARRWAEEVELLREEMRRTIVTLRGRARLWEARAMDDWSQFGPDYVQGLCAYAFSQADLLSRLAQKYEHTWTGIGGNVDDAESDADLERDLQNQQHEERVEEAEEGR
ncbi:hypothetical protein EYR36_001576 [Pleurotus pulmonarius]|nr:hypothetical protein EYR36_001576 [Pleurotus pulmonarius]